MSAQTYPVDIRKTWNGWRIAKLGSIIPSPPSPISNTFMQYCLNLEPWESQLLANATLQFPPNDIMQKLSTQEFRACSDGSAITLQGTFGWVLALPDRTRLAFGAGPVEGHDPNSFRAEGQGMLSVVCFLKRLKEWTNSSLPLTGILATDNSPLLDRVKEQAAVKYPIPNATFKSDWDVVEAIARNVEEAGILPEYRHVKGHQDKDTEYSKLSFLSQLNVDADKYAGVYQSQYGSHRPLIQLSPTRPIAIDIDGKTIHRHFKSAIREAAHYQLLMNRMKVRNRWEDHVPETIDWEAHRLATSGTHRNRQNHFVKLCHGYLPTGKIAHRNNPSYPDWCPLCKHPGEDHQHILQCMDASRIAWRNTFLHKISNKCKTLQTDPVLSAILCNGMKSWLQKLPFDEGGIPSKYQLLLDSQRDIGWYHIFLARFTKQWSHLQSQYLHSQNIKIKGLTGDSWTKIMSTTIIILWLELWDARNKDRHGKDSTQISKLAHEQAIREITILYTYKRQVLQRDRHIFDKDLQYHIQGETRYLRQWINTHQPVILKSTKTAKINSAINVRTIPSYFKAKKIPH